MGPQACCLDILDLVCLWSGHIRTDGHLEMEFLAQKKKKGII